MIKKTKYDKIFFKEIIASILAVLPWIFLRLWSQQLASWIFLVISSGVAFYLFMNVMEERSKKYKEENKEQNY